ncbi:hypothetical protein IFM89_011371 [Coptis chinensis]|uniref:RRM domain-containing protein n=1 Tax=Coptis chinensis TaxID=261450 RepID=A0A835LMR3_9MAGN|nr:hypothetical protein IFM89_011371 [Coptis chinensis]
MALAEQPLKKRKVHENVIDPHGFQQSFVSPLTQDEILRKQRNKAEVRSLYDCYRRIKFCISQKDARLMPDFEQAYLALITASRGCTSAQRILAELIPRYASHCPTALEAAAKVAINMYSWNFSMILNGDDSDGVALLTAKACVIGLVDICCAAASEAPTSSVIRGICSAVFVNVLTFFISSFEGKDIYQIDNEDIAKLQDLSDCFSELKQKVESEDESPLSKLFKFRVLSMIRIFFCCPKNLIEACFELFKSSSADVGLFKGGNYFLRQITSQIPSADETCAEKTGDGDEATSCMDSAEATVEGVQISTDRLLSDEKRISADASLVTKNCLVGMALTKDPSLRHWILLKYKKLCKSVCSQAASDISSAFEGTFQSFRDVLKEVDSEEESNEDISDPSMCISRHYLIPRIHENSSEQSDKDRPPRVYNALISCALNEDREFDDKLSGRPGKHWGGVAPPRIDSQSFNLSHESEGSWSVKDMEIRERGNSCHEVQSKRGSNFLSPVNKTVDSRNDGIESGNHLVRTEKNQVSNDLSSPAMRSASGSVSNFLASPDQHSSLHYHSSNPTVWYFDGNSAAMGVFSASKQLWLGSLGSDVSETGVRFQVEKFGPIEQFMFFPIKGFALVEYMNIMDAVKAREYMRGSSPWGARLQVKFLDVGLGSRGSINGVAVGSSCHVYVGNVSSQWIKDEILHEVTKVGFRTRMVSDLTSENALLMEFEAAEEAAIVMGRLRQQRKENGNYISLTRSLSSSDGTSDVSRCHMDGARFNRTPVGTEIRSNNSVNMPTSLTGSPRVPTELDPNENCRMRMSQLSSYVLSLSSKYNISRNCHAIISRDEIRMPTNTLWINLPHISSTFLTDDELMAVCSHAVGNVGSAVKLTRENMQMSSCWYVEFNSVDAAMTAMKNLRSCPGMFFQIEFSQPGKNHSIPFINRSESGTHELTHPRVDSENRGTMGQSGQAFPMNWTSSGCTEMTETVSGNYAVIDGPNSNMAVKISQASHAASHVGGQMWAYNKPETELQNSAAVSIQRSPMVTQGPPVLPPQPHQGPPFMRPVYLAPGNSWDGHTVNHPFPSNHFTPNVRPSNFHVNVGAAPFIPPSVTPLAAVPGGSMHHVDHIVTRPIMPPISPVPPPNMGPPLPPSPPPLPMSQPPMVPPPPSSPPPLPSPFEPPNLDNAGQGQWQGVLCKSGVHYCTLYAHREDSDACKYSNAISEPAGWPARLDVTKRTDFQHVKSTFTNTPPHKREVCRLLPSTSGDLKGFQDFISYLKQRECAGVIKIPAVNSMWARLLFILPYSHDTCSMLAITPHPSECLIALVLPKETSFEWV